MDISLTELRGNLDVYLKLAQIEDVHILRDGKRIAILHRITDPFDKYRGVAESQAVYRTEKSEMTLEEFYQLSDASENRYELIDGEVYQLASPTFEHQRIVMEMAFQVKLWSQEKKCQPITAPFDITLLKEEKYHVVQSDIAVICDPENVNNKSKYTGTPTIVMEVLSDSTQSKDMLTKLNLYMSSGIREYWIVSPRNREIYVYSFEDGDIRNHRAFKGDETSGSEALEGLGISLQRIFSGG